MEFEDSLNGGVISADPSGSLPSSGNDNAFVVFLIAPPLSSSLTAILSSLFDDILRLLSQNSLLREGNLRSLCIVDLTPFKMSLSTPFLTGNVESGGRFETAVLVKILAPSSAPGTGGRVPGFLKN